VQTIVRHLYQATCTAANTVAEQFVYHRRSTSIVAVSGRLRDELVHDARVDPRRIRVIMNGVDTAEFSPSGSTAERRLLRGRLHLPDAPLLLFVGDLRSRRKGLGTVLHALPEMPPDAHLLVVGDATRSPYPAEVKAAGLDARVTFLGFRRDVPALVRAADIFVFPSHYEACSLAVLEAMSSGLPVVTTATGGASEVITSGLDGVLLDDATDHRALARNVNELLANAERRQALAAAARATALRYDWSRVMAQVETLLRDHAREKEGATA
jgi:glycosyltransferase involved in cell wall biosynthesis